MYFKVSHLWRHIGPVDATDRWDIIADLKDSSWRRDRLEEQEEEEGERAEEEEEETWRQSIMIHSSKYLYITLYYSTEQTHTDSL